MKSFFYLISLASIAVAANDWDRACHGGQCAWDVPYASADGGSASFQLWSASPAAIADITPAAGWTILTCLSSGAAQTVRIACMDTSLGCSHLLDPKTNPISRIVRLTDECGIMPFARIAHMRLADDQTLPSVLSRRAAPPAVYDVALDTDFGADSEHGIVNFALTAASFPNVRASTIERVPRGRFQPRTFVDEQDQVIKRAYMAHGLREVTTGLEEDFDIGSLDDFDEEKSMSFPVNIDQANLNVFNTSINCQSSPVPFDASVSADVDALINLQFTLGFVATGKFVPPELDTAAITAGMSGSIDSALHIKASADGTFSSPSITLLDIPIPGSIEIPEILTIGPQFKVLASANANLGGGIDTTIGLTYQVDNASMIFPPDQGENGGAFTPKETPMQLSMDTNFTGSVSLTGHLIPELVIGIEALKGLVKSEITLSLDTSATVTVNGDVGPTKSNLTAVATPQGACVDVSTALAVNAGASAGLFDIFNAGASVNLFNKSFDLYNTCVDSGDTNSTSSARRSLSARALPVPVTVQRVAPVEVQSLNKRSDITCPKLPFNIDAPSTTTMQATPTATSS